MYCVCCGSPLTEANQAGIVCQACKQCQQARRCHHWGLPITVRYCSRCGHSYSPPDASLTHLSCRFFFRPIDLHPQANHDL
jgi:hypothetical protein